MKVCKRAFINLIRMPIRNLLYFLIVFVMIFVTMVCGKLYQTGNASRHALEREYPIIATVTPATFVHPDGTVSRFAGELTLDDLMVLQQFPSVYAYQYCIDAGRLAEPEVISQLPGEYLLEREPLRIIEQDSAVVEAVTNIMMEQEFLDGSYCFIAGAPFDEKDIEGCKNSIIISRTTAEKYDLGVGDPITFCPWTGMYCSMQIKGIYESVANDPVTVSYVPLTFLFTEWATQYGGGSRVDSEVIDGEVVRVRDSVQRIDFCLTDAEAADDFVKYAMDQGLTHLTVTVNDKVYKMADMGLEQMTTVALFLVIASLIAGVVVIVSITAYCRSTRVREAKILHCLGMKKRAIRAMFAVEMVLVFSLGAVFGGLFGVTVSDLTIELVKEGYIAEMQAQADKPVFVDETLVAKRGAVRTYPLFIRFGEAGDVPDTKANFVPAQTIIPIEGEMMIRYEEMYARPENKGIYSPVTLIGRTDVLYDGTVTKDILYHEKRTGTVTFSCIAGADTGYAVGDRIRVSRGIAGTSVFCSQNIASFSYITRQPAYVWMVVTDIGEGDGLTLSMTDLEWLCSYLGASSEVYRSVRYDECILKED